MRALQNLPRERAIDGIHAFNNMRCALSPLYFILPEAELIVVHRDGLMQFLRPFAQEGKVVAEEDIHRFFQNMQGANQKPNA